MKNWNYTLGVDVSKKTLDIHCAELNQHIQVANDQQGFNHFLKWCKLQSISLKESFMVMEYTGGYEYGLIQFCEAKQIKYTRISGLAIKRSMGIIRGKSDKVDAARIAQFGEEKHKLLSAAKPLNESIVQLKGLLAFRKRMVRDLAGFKATLSERKKMYMQSKSDVISTTIEKLIELNQEMVATLDQELMVIINQNQALKTNYDLLVSIRGIGKINAMMTIAYTENFVCFINPRSYAVYVGVIPFEYSSGTSVRGRKQTSNIANKELKQELNQAARSAIQWDPELKQYAERKMQNKCYGIVLNNVKFKLILRMFSIVRRQTKFVDNYKNIA